MPSHQGNLLVQVQHNLLKTRSSPKRIQRTPQRVSQAHPKLLPLGGKLLEQVKTNRPDHNSAR
ncbi:MAG: hypothetical protein R6V55_11930 [Desulfovermiculus sp.]